MNPVPPNPNADGAIAQPSLTPSSEVGSGLDSHWRAMFEMQQKNMMQLIEAIRTPTVAPQITLPEINPELPDTDPRAWCDTIDICLDERPLEGASLIIALSKALKGNASSWLSQISHAGMTWQHFRDLFLARYASTETLAASLVNIHNGRPKEGECLAAYASRLMTTLLARWKNRGHEEIATSYVLAHVSQFDSRLNRLAFTSEITSRNKLLQEIKASASLKRKFDRSTGDGATDAKRFKPQTSTMFTCHKCGKPGHKAVNCRSKFTQPAGTNVQKTTPVATSSGSSKRVTCFRCGEAGHISTNCQRGSAGGASSSAGSAANATAERRVDSCEIAGVCGQLEQSGGCFGSQKKRTIVGGWAWAWWWVTDVQRISLEVMTLNPVCEYVETAQGVPLSITGAAQCKIMNEDELLTTACEQFLGKPVDDIKMTILQTLEGHLRAILGTLTVEEVYKDRDQFAALVREVAAPDVGRMGIEILSFTIKDVYDDVEYLSSLGKSQTAVVKRDADVGVAQANRDAGIREAECERSAMDVKYAMDTKIEDNTRMYMLQKAQFDQEVNTAKAEAALAYELQAAKIKQKIRSEEIEIEVVERRKQIQVELQEILRREEELNAQVRLPAEAEAYRLQTIAEGNRTKTVEEARADAERMKVLGLAEAAALGDVGKADAERMLAKAKVYKQYGEAAIMALVLEALPKIAAEVSAPLSKTDEIVLVGDGGVTGEVARLVGGLPPAVKTLTGLDLNAVFKRLEPAKAQ